MCECTSIIPGVTYFPDPSITNASAGAATAVPTAIIFPSRSNTEPFVIVGPAAVMIVALRISVVRRGKGLYVLGNGFAFGIEVPPAPGDGAGEGAACEADDPDSFSFCACVSGCVANASNRQPQPKRRIDEVILPSNLLS